MTRDELIAALEKAEGPSRELDATIAYHAGEARLGLPVPETWLAKHYTSSIDAALTLVPEGWRVNSISNVENGWHAVLVRGQWNVAGYATAGSVVSVTPAIALCIAALKARGEA